MVKKLPQDVSAKNHPASTRVRPMSFWFLKSIRMAMRRSYLPFAQTAAQRQASNDSRLTLAERYRCRADYVAQIAVAAQALVNRRLLLAEDSDRYVEHAMQTNAFA
jgi:hypothetical protein